jgi:hypothetical protein
VNRLLGPKIIAAGDIYPMSFDGRHRTYTLKCQGVNVTLTSAEVRKLANWSTHGSPSRPGAGK